MNKIKYTKAQGTASERLIEQIDYGYDAAGQRTSKTTLNANGTGANETPMRASFDAANRMTSITLNLGAVNGVATSKTYTLSYDANGNLTRKQNNADANDNTVYTWDANNRLTQMAQSTGTGSSGTGLTASFSYDAFGRRIQSSITRANQSASTVQYLYEGQQALGEIRDGKLGHRLLTGLSLDETIARFAINTAGTKDAAQSRIYLTDALNSVIAQLGDDDSASLQNSYAYSPYGQTTTVGPDGTNNPNQYTSRENDNTGLYFYRARYYDPVLKRFINEDPIGLAGGLNTYGYVEGNPLSFIDPMGLWITATYDQKTGNLYVYDDTTGTMTTGSFESGGKPWGASIPNGDYDLLGHPDPDFFRLEPVDSSYGDDTDSRTGRDKFRLHRPGRTLGCIAATDRSSWDQIRDLIRNTRTRDQVPVNSKSRNPFSPRKETLPRYGRLTVVNSN